MEKESKMVEEKNKRKSSERLESTISFDTKFSWNSYGKLPYIGNLQDLHGLLWSNAKVSCKDYLYSASISVPG